MADHVEVMIAAVAVAILVMYFASEPVAAFIERHPTTKMLALSFLLLIGAALIADGFHFHIPRAYLYFAMAFSAAVEAVNVIAMRNRRKSKRGKAGRGEVIDLKYPNFATQLPRASRKLTAFARRNRCLMRR